MKVNDLQRQLDEGFLDNLVSKVQSMAGGDGPTGIIRALRGSNAALRKFADAIANTARPRVMQRVGNQLAQINDGSVPLPVKMIYQQTLAAADKIAATDQTEIEPALPQVKPTIKSNRADIERLVLSSNVGANNEIKLLFDAILGGTGSASIGIEVESALNAISMIVAATVIFIQTQQEDAETAEVDPDALENFKTASAQLDKVLFSQQSPDLRSLNPNVDLRDNLEELVLINMITGQIGIQKKYLNLSTEQMQAMLASLPLLVSNQALTRLLSSHSPDVDPAAVNSVVNKAEELIEEQFKAWLQIAVAEQPPRARAFEIYKEWARAVHAKIKSMNFEQPATSTEPATPTTSIDTDELFDKAHDMGERARRAVTKTPGEADANFVARQNAAYTKAHDEYLTANPLP
jgi:hypothetical protein